MLQLGHAGEGVEMCDMVNFDKNDLSFNWATPVKAWRSLIASQGFALITLLQLGHAGEGVEIRQPRIIFPTSTSFNWATPVKAWRCGTIAWH